MKKDIFYVIGNFYVGQRGNQQILDVTGKETLIDSNVLFVRDDDGRFVRAPDYCNDEALSEAALKARDFVPVLFPGLSEGKEGWSCIVERNGALVMTDVYRTKSAALARMLYHVSVNDYYGNSDETDFERRDDTGL